MDDERLIWESYLQILTEGKEEPKPKKQTIKSVEYPSKDSLSEQDKKDSFKNLTEVEINQLGTKNFVSKEQWPYVRKFMLLRSLASNPKTDPELTAYTPGETWALFNNPVIKKWHSDIVNHIVPSQYDTVVFVPCAKTKPWENATGGGIKLLYPSYNRLKKEYGNLYFVTISEPLGIVPSDMWGSFPQYDNPGLFSNDPQRSGLMTSDWKRLFGVKSKLVIPFDKSKQQECIALLGNVVKQFIVKNKEVNPKLEMLSFVEDFRDRGTHSQMLDIANEIDQTLRFYKRKEKNQTPYDYIKDTLKGLRRINK